MYEGLPGFLSSTVWAGLGARLRVAGGGPKKRQTAGEASGGGRLMGLLEFRLSSYHNQATPYMNISIYHIYVYVYMYVYLHIVIVVT